MLYQVNKLSLKRNLLRQFIRYVHNEQSGKILYSLENRRLLNVSGPEAGLFLQGLITNDMRHFEEGAKSMYAMFLNNKGRVLYDTMIHTVDETESFMIECDKNITTQLLRHLKLFKLKRKIEISDASQDYNLWAYISPQNILPDLNDHNTKIYIFKDPRLSELGYRILSPACFERSYITNIIGKDVVIEKSEDGYKILRYKLGVSEGPDDLPPGSSFPLEVNCDYLHGVSFHKGCYIGQEITARVHHTGVVRKRIMPLLFNDNLDDLPKNAVISDSNKPKSNVGKLKGVLKNYGIGLMRIREALDASALQLGNQAVKVVKPSWWPIEAPKEKASANKLSE